MRFAGVVLCGARILAGQPGAVVTEKMQIRIDGRVQTARKINGRWWSQDNRELKRTNATWLWDISGGNARELVRFDHHYPFDASKVNLVDRSMGPDQVKAVLGAPNSIFPSDRPEQHQHWDYYGPDGYKLSIQFSASGEGIFTASFQPDACARPQDVPHLTFRFSSRFNGKTTQESFEESKQKGPTRAIPGSTAEYRAQLMAEMAARRAGLQTRASAMVENASAATPAQPLPPARKLTQVRHGIPDSIDF